MTRLSNIFPTVFAVLILSCSIHSEETAGSNPVGSIYKNNNNVTGTGLNTGGDSLDGHFGSSNSTNGGLNSRPKRNSVGSSNTVEGLLASCQLTNLLLYQALQQQRQAQANPLLALATQNLQGLGSNLNLNSLPLSPGLSLTPGVQNIGGIANLLNSFPGAINQNLIFPAAATLQTYTTTTTFVTKMTTTGVVTVPLLFGNKVSQTVVTRTKTYDVTTSSVQTLTSTIQPTVAATEAAKPIAPTSTQAASDSILPTKVNTLERPSKDKLPEYEEYYEEPEAHYQNDVQADPRPSTTSNIRRGQVRHASKAEMVQDTSENVRVPEKFSAFSKTSKTRGSDTSPQKRRKSRPSQTQPQPSTQIPTQTQRSQSRYGQTKDETLIPNKQKQKYEAEEDYYSPRGSEKRNKDNLHDSQFYNRQYGTLQDDDAAVAVDEDPAAAQYPDDYSYYARRLKRGEQGGDADEEEDYAKLDREYLLEPSSDGDYSGNYQKYEKCPPIPANNIPTTVTVTSTETRTITKFLKGQSSTATPTASVNNNYYGNVAATTTSRGFTPSGSSRSRSSYKRNKQDNVAESSYPAAVVTSTSERSTTDRRAQILRRSRSRYTPSQDYEYRG